MKYELCELTHIPSVWLSINVPKIRCHSPKQFSPEQLATLKQFSPMREVGNQTNPLSVSFSIYPYPTQEGLFNMELPWGQYNQVPDGIGYSDPTCEFSEILNDFVWLLQHVSHDCTLAIRGHAGPPDRPGGTWVACLVNTSKWCGHDVFPAQWVNLLISWRL